MDDPTLHRRLDRFERRQSVVLGLLVGAYLLAGVWFLVDELALVSPWTAAVAATVGLVLAVTVGIVRRRRASS